MAGPRKTPEEKAEARKRSNAAISPTNFRNRTPEERSEIARLGNLAQQAVKKRRKAFREYIETLGMCPGTSTEKEKFAAMFPDVDLNEVTKDMMLLASMYYQAIVKGNVKAANFIRDTVGEKPDTTISGTITTEKIFVTEEEKDAALKHIAEVVADGNDGD